MGGARRGTAPTTQRLGVQKPAPSHGSGHALGALVQLLEPRVAVGMQVQRQQRSRPRSAAAQPQTLDRGRRSLIQHVLALGSSFTCCLSGAWFNRRRAPTTAGITGAPSPRDSFCGGSLLLRTCYYFAEAGNAGNLSTSRASCWMMTVALRFAAIFLMRSIDATVCARSVLNIGTPPPS
jgi:hypothetical protein